MERHIHIINGNTKASSLLPGCMLSTITFVIFDKYVVLVIDVDVDGDDDDDDDDDDDVIMISVYDGSILGMNVHTLCKM